MKFFPKFLISIFLIIALLILHCYTAEIGSFNLKLRQTELSIGLYLILAGIVAISFLLSTVRNLMEAFIGFFKKDSNEILKERLDKMAVLIQLEGKEFQDTIKKTEFPKEFEILKNSLIINKNSDEVSNLNLTGVKLLDVRIMKHKLKKLIDSMDFQNAIKLAQRFVDDYSQYLPNIKDEILKIGCIARKKKIRFSFDPRKFKYNLPLSFVEKYLFLTDCAELDNENSKEAKLKILEKIVKNHSELPDSFNLLLKFLKDNNMKVQDEAIIDAIKKSFKIQPNRNLAYELIGLNKPDQFEIAQDITKCVSENNIERLWFLLIVALKSGFYSKANEIIRRFHDENDIANALLCYYKAKPEEIANLRLG